MDNIERELSAPKSRKSSDGTLSRWKDTDSRISANPHVSSKEVTTTISQSSQEMKGLQTFLKTRKSFNVTNPNKSESEKTISTLYTHSFERIVKMLGIDLVSALYYLNLVIIQVSEITTKRKEKRKKKTRRKQTERSTTSLMSVEVNPIYGKIAIVKKSYTILFPNKYSSQDDIISKSNELKDASLRRILRLMGITWEEAFGFISITVVNYLYEEMKRQALAKKKKQKKKTKRVIQEVDIDPSFKKLLEFLKIYGISCPNNPENDGLYVPKVSVQRIIRMMGIHWYYIVEYLQVNVTIFTEYQYYQRLRITNLNRKSAYEDTEERTSKLMEEKPSNKWNKSKDLQINSIFDRIYQDYLFISNPNKYDVDRFQIVNETVNEIIDKATDEAIEREPKEVEPIEIEVEPIEIIEEKPLITPYVFCYKKKVNYGDAIYLIGSCEELYEWDITKAIRLEWFSGDIWIAIVNIKDGNYPFQFRYFISNYRKIFYPVEWIETIDVQLKHYEMLKKFEAESLKVMSYDLRYENELDNVNIWNNRKTLASQMIANVSSDIIGIQEGKPNQVKFIKNNFIPIYNYEGMSRSYDPKDEHVGIYYNNQKFIAVNSGHFWLSDTPWIKGSICYGNLFPRMSSWVQLRKIEDVLNLENSRNYLVFNTHFDHSNYHSRLPCAKALIQEINIIIQGIRSTNPKAEFVVILTGSFYSQDEDPAISFIKNNGFVSTSEQMNNYCKTFHNFSGHGISKWDHIFYKTVGNLMGKLENLTKSYEILTDSEVREDQTIFLSDHYPIYAVISDHI